MGLLEGDDEHEFKDIAEMKVGGILDNLETEHCSHEGKWSLHDKKH